MLHNNSATTKFNQLKDAAIQFLKDKNFMYEESDDSGIIWLNLSGENGCWRVVIIAEEDRKIIQIRSICPVTIKDNQKIKIAELLTRLNSQLLFGNFIFNFEEGEITFKTINLFKDGILSNEPLEILFNTNMSTLDDCIPAIIAVNSGFTEPVLAISHQ